MMRYSFFLSLSLSLSPQINNVMYFFMKGIGTAYAAMLASPFAPSSKTYITKLVELVRKEDI